MERTDGDKSHKSRNTWKGSGINQTVNSVNMNSEAVEKPGYSGSRPSMDHAQMHEEITTPLVLAGKLVLDLAEDGTPLLLLVVSSGSNALAARSALGRHIRVFPEFLGRRGCC
jgi:hypothetical protein